MTERPPFYVSDVQHMLCKDLRCKTQARATLMYKTGSEELCYGPRHPHALFMSHITCILKILGNFDTL